jgi:transposase
MKHKSKMCRIQIYDEAFKRKVIEEYLTSGISKVDLLRKYNIRTKSGIQRWMKRFGYVDPHRPVNAKFTDTTSFTLTKKSTSSDNVELLQKIKDLERQLVDEKLRSEAYARIIEKAEKELKISLKKKFNTK